MPGHLIKRVIRTILKKYSPYRAYSSLWFIDASINGSSIPYLAEKSSIGDIWLYIYMGLLCTITLPISVTIWHHFIIQQIGVWLNLYYLSASSNEKSLTSLLRIVISNGSAIWMIDHSFIKQADYHLWGLIADGKCQLLTLVVQGLIGRFQVCELPLHSKNDRLRCFRPCYGCIL